MIPFSPPHIDPKTIDEIADTLKSGWITTGPKTKKFEQELEKFTAAPKVLAVSSATAGLELMLRWFGVKEGDEVVIPAYTYCATGNVVLHCGATPVIVDVNKDDFNISVQAIEKAITSKTKAIIPVDFAGFPCNYEKINTLVKEKANIFQPTSENQEKLGRIMVLSDAAHSLGAEFNNKKTGSLTDLTVFSFHAVKNLTTAEGGAICLNLPAPFDNREVYKYLNIKSLHGQSKDALAKSQKGGWEYDVIEPGYKCNMTDIQAAIGLVALEKYADKILPRRKEIFDAYAETFSRYEWAELPVYETEEKRSSYHLYPLRIKNISEQQRSRIIQRVTDQEVSVNVHFKPLPLLSLYKNLGYKIENYPAARDNYSREISLPVYYDLSDEQVQQVVKAVVRAVENLLRQP